MERRALRGAWLNRWLKKQVLRAWSNRRQTHGKPGPNASPWCLVLGAGLKRWCLVENAGRQQQVLGALLLVWEL